MKEKMHSKWRKFGWVASISMVITTLIFINSGCLPDLIVTDFSIIPTSRCIADPMRAIIVISNIGGVSEKDTTVAIKRNGILIGTLQVPKLKQRSNVTLSQSLTFPGAGRYIITVVVDPNNLITEANDANNNFKADITVQDCSSYEQYYQEWRSTLVIDDTSSDPINRMFLSSDPNDYTDHPAFEAIVAEGNSALMFVMSKIEQGDFLMNIAASRITGINPWADVVVDKNWGTTGNLIGAQQTSLRWLEWWNENKNDPQWQP